MALTDPQIVALSGANLSLAKVYTQGTESRYASSDAKAELTVRHRYGARNQHQSRFVINKIAADPLTAINKKCSMTVAFSVDVKGEEFTTIEVVAALKMAADKLTATSNEFATRIAGGES